MGNTKSKLIKILEETHSRLEEFGKKSETFDDVLNRILDGVKK